MSIDQKVMSSNPGRSKGVFFSSKFINSQALCLGGHPKVRVPGATIALKNISCVIKKYNLTTPQYYALNGALLYEYQLESKPEPEQRAAAHVLVKN